MSLGASWMLLLLPLVALAGWLLSRARRLQWLAACQLKGVAPETRSAGLGRNDYLTLAALACTVVALARPQWNPRPYSVERRGRDLVIVLDISRSMLAADVFPSRLETARMVIHEALPALVTQRIALVTFAGSASVRVPLTLDHDFVRYMLQRADPLDADVGSTSLQAAFETVVDTVSTDTTSGPQDVIVFTDGEDHLSDIEQTAQMLAKCGARVLIIGLGDPVRGARVPAVSEAERWMRHQDAEVVSRLEEGTLAKLSERSPHVTYYPARTRPFDLVPLYEEMVSGAAGDVVVGELQEMRYTEGYPFLLGLAVALWFASWRRGPSLARPLLLAVLLFQGCKGPTEDGVDAEYQARFERGAELLQYAQEQSAVDPFAGRSLLRDSREEFLRAALLKPGDIASAQQITVTTHRLRDLEAAIAERREAETDRREDLSELVKRLQQLTEHQTSLAQQSRNVLRRRPIPRDGELKHLAAPIVTEQQTVREETVSVLETVTSHRDALRQLLKQAYGVNRLPPTELDPAASLLAEATDAQQQALAGLVRESVRWPQTNTALHIAAGRMQQALESLRSLLPPTADQTEKTKPKVADSGDEKDTTDADSGAEGTQSQQVSPGDFASALSLRSLPKPNHTSADILAEEVANQQERAKNRAARAGAQVEKNW